VWLEILCNSNLQILMCSSYYKHMYIVYILFSCFKCGPASGFLFSNDQVLSVVVFVTFLMKNNVSNNVQ